MPAAARVGDATAHPGTVVGPGVPTVLIEGIPAAAVGDIHACAYPYAPPHFPTVITRGSSSVMIGGRPAARQGDMSGCGSPILIGAATVVIGG